MAKETPKSVTTNNSGNRVTVVANRGPKLRVKVEGNQNGKRNN